VPLGGQFSRAVDKRNCQNRRAPRAGLRPPLGLVPNTPRTCGHSRLAPVSLEPLPPDAGPSSNARADSSDASRGPSLRVQSVVLFRHHRISVPTSYARPKRTRTERRGGPVPGSPPETFAADVDADTAAVMPATLERRLGGHALGHDGVAVHTPRGTCWAPRTEPSRPGSTIHGRAWKRADRGGASHASMVSQPEAVTRLILSAVEETSRSQP
jgi:hypothetical protein